MNHRSDVHTVAHNGVANLYVARTYFSIEPIHVAAYRKLDKQPITESPTMRSLVSNGITSLVVFKTIRCSRRIKLWNRQASIIRDLTTLALHHEERCLPRV
jgi:hypothetical protein